MDVPWKRCVVGGQSDAEDTPAIEDADTVVAEDLSERRLVEDIPTANDDDVEDLSFPSVSQPSRFPCASQFHTAYDFGDGPHFEYDRDRCEALVWVATGVSLRQCSNPRKFGERCGTHKKKAPHGTVWSPSVSKLTESQKQPSRRTAFTWYCRLRLWHEARNNYKKTINALSDDEFEA